MRHPAAKSPAAIPLAVAIAVLAPATAGAPRSTSGITAATHDPPPAPRRPAAFRIEQVKPGASVVLRARPGRQVVSRVGSETQFGSRQTLAVAARRGRWLGVKTSALGGRGLAWVDGRAAALRTTRTRYSVRVDLSRRRLELRRDRRVLRRARVSIGSPASPTPRGRFAVTDKLPGSRFSPVYGCCILALSAQQSQPPPGWTGGTRVAIHGTDSPGAVGGRSTAGCVSGQGRDLRLLMRRVPLGAPVFIRR